MPVIILRHGTAASPSLQANLTPAGVQAVKDTLAKLPAVPLDQIFSSPLPRAQETAQLWSQQSGKPVSSHPELEAWNLGAYRGKHSAEADAIVKKLVSVPQMPAPGGGESALQYWQRFLPFVLPLVSDPQWHGVVTHSRGIRTLESFLKGGGQGLDAEPWSREPLVPPGGAVIVTPQGVEPVK